MLGTLGPGLGWAPTHWDMQHQRAAHECVLHSAVIGLSKGRPNGQRFGNETGLAWIGIFAQPHSQKPSPHSRPIS